ncbi:hypothetical protein OAU25_03200, partial [Crocinitomicaceae bacterium]|nr:hypothetical protein [Crocinitomicaceae bacterium]
MNRIIIAILFLSSLSWIVFVSIDLASEKYNYSPESLFNHNDSELLIINRPSEIDPTKLEAFADIPAIDLIQSINDSIYNTGFFSQRRGHFLLVKNNNWKKESIKNLFSGKMVTFSSSSEFKIEGYNGRFHKSKLYVWKPNVNNSGIENDASFNFDKKASAAIVRFGENTEVNNYSDIYVKSTGTTDYITRDANIEQGNQVKDESIFARIITRNFNSYHFFERDYYASLDPKFKEGPMSKWILNGFVELEYKGERVIVSDFIGGQDPILILNDLNQTTDSTRFERQLTSSFPSKGNSYTIKYLEDAVVIAENASIAEQVISDYKLGNTIELNSESRKLVFGDLPRSVSERFISLNGSYSKAVYEGKLLETHTNSSTLAVIADPYEARTISMSCGFDIWDFMTLPGNGNVIAVGVNGEIKHFVNGEINWENNIKGKPQGPIQIIDLHGRGEQFALINTRYGIHLLDMSGNYQTGFPIDLESEALNEVKFYRWKNKGYFLIANEEDNVVKFDAKGRELAMIPVGMQINKKIDVWASQRRLFAGFANSEQFKMYDFEKKRMHREFPIDSNTISLKIPNELLQYSIRNDQLIKLDQKGIKFEFDRYLQSKLIGIQKNNPLAV